MGRSRSSLAVGHTSKGAAKVRSRSSLMSGLWLVERVDELGGRLRQRSALSQSELASEIWLYTCFESAAYAILSIV
jgi:hypothetical protein